MDRKNEAVAMDLLLEDFDPTAVVAEPLPTVVTSDVNCDLIGKLAEDLKGSLEKPMVLGRNVHTTCLAVTEPEANDEFTGDKDAYMASVLARYRKTLVERTKHHLGTFHFCDFLLQCFEIQARILNLNCGFCLEMQVILTIWTSIMVL